MNMTQQRRRHRSLNKRTEELVGDKAGNVYLIRDRARRKVGTNNFQPHTMFSKLGGKTQWVLSEIAKDVVFPIYPRFTKSFGTANEKRFRRVEFYTDRFEAWVVHFDLVTRDENELGEVTRVWDLFNLLLAEFPGIEA